MCRNSPVSNREKAHCQERQEKPGTDCGADVLADEDGQEGHERDRHRQPIPDQAVVGRSEVIVARAKGHQDGPEEECEIGRAQRRKNTGRGPRAHHEEARQADRKKGEVRYNIPEVWNAEDGALIGEGVIALRLANRAVDDDCEGAGKDDPCQQHDLSLTERK